MRGLTLAICGLAMFAATGLRAAECPGNPNALGTSRTLVVDPTEHPRLGGMQYHESLPLQDHEVVLTFDDGPLPPKSSRVLEILASECVKATYFMVGKMARTYPDLVRRIQAAGHTIGTHSYDHPLSFHKMPVSRAEEEVNDGIAWVNWALGGTAKTAPFFRIPGLLRADGVERYLASQHIQVWSADFPADDWTKIKPAQVYERALKRIEANHKGILLLHDIQTRTVEALPNLLHELKRRGYRIVHVVPATPELPKTETAAADWVLHNHKLWPMTPIFAEQEEPELPAPSPESFGAAAPLVTQSVIHPLTRHQRTARGQIPLPPVSIWPNTFELPEGSAPSRTLLPAPNPQEFGVPVGTPAKSDPRALFDLVPETNGLATDIRRALARDLTPDDRPTGTIAPAPLRGPIPGEAMPRGAFP